eukprot:150347-Prymnesium_polylepis.2
MATVLPTAPAVARVEAGALASVYRAARVYAWALTALLASHFVCRLTITRCSHCMLPTSKRHLVTILPYPTCPASRLLASRSLPCTSRQRPLCILQQRPPRPTTCALSCGLCRIIGHTSLAGSFCRLRVDCSPHARPTPRPTLGRCRCVVRSAAFRTLPRHRTVLVACDAHISMPHHDVLSIVGVIVLPRACVLRM